MYNPVVKPFWDQPTGSWQYVFDDPDRTKGAMIDAVLDYDPLSGATSNRNAEPLLAYIRETGIDLVRILDTHPHAGHFMAAHWLRTQTGAPSAIGAKVTGVQKLWKENFNLPGDFPTDGHQWDQLFADGETFMVGNVPVSVMFTPGHTLASITYVAGDAAFVNDTPMMPDSGTAGADFPGDSSAELYAGLQEILALPDQTRRFIGHDDAPDREAQCKATLAEHRAHNIHRKDDPSEARYCARRDTRDATLTLPERMLAALQVNIRGGRLPDAEENGLSYLKVPLDYSKIGEASRSGPSGLGDKVAFGH